MRGDGTAVRANYKPVIKEFNSDRIKVTFKNDEPNLFLAIKNATVLNPKVQNGYFTGLVFDK